MASSRSTTTRLLKELQDYTSNPNEALLHLGLINDEDLLHWEAVLKGVNGTPYEGNHPPNLFDIMISRT
jgi:peroxin-4